jgi:formamidopyrimidine-DNA glycosylase
MPELPEVETIIRGLEKSIIGRKIINVRVREEKLIAFPEPGDFIVDLRGRKISNISRRGKYILINLTANKTLVIHLRMTGQLMVKRRSEFYRKHTHVIFELDDGTDLRFNNTRKFGRLYLVETGKWERVGGLSKLGPEPLSDELSLNKFKSLFKNRRGKIKSLLLNQRFIAGLGNIYSDEALFMAGIKPGRHVSTLSESEIERLYYAIRNILKLGIEYGGTTLRDYLTASGEKGGFQNKLKVFQRSGEYCPICHSKIVKEKVGGRTSHFCPKCQS